MQAGTYPGCKIWGGAKLFLEGQLSTQTENVNTYTKRTRFNISENIIFQENIEFFCLIGDMSIFT